MKLLFKNFFFLICFLMVNNCATTGSAFLGPIFTGAKTGSVYQASLSYGTGKILNELNPISINMSSNIKKKQLLDNISFTNKDPTILVSYKVDIIEFSEIIEPEPLP